MRFTRRQVLKAGTAAAAARLWQPLAAQPGTTQPHHAVDKLGAARGALPDQTTRRRMEQLIDGLPS